MTLVRWSDPFRELAQFQDRLNRVFFDANGRPPVRVDDTEGLTTSGGWVPAVDIYQGGEQELVIKAELPDMTREAIDITVENGTLTIKGEKKLDVKDEHVHRIERRYGAFSRSFALPPTVDAAKVSADYKNGVLTVRLPLREEARPRQIKIDVAA